MKKHLTKLLSILFGATILLTGCATVSNIKNDNKDLIYYGGNVVTVGDYTYFSNAYTESTSSDKETFDYRGKSEISYLARINNSKIDTKGKDFSPSKVDKVNSKVTGYQNQDMFVLGNYIYYTSMNTHKDSNLKHDYSLVTFWRSKLNGDSVKELFTTEYFGSDAKFAPVGDAKNGYYWICYTGAYAENTAHSGEIISVKLGNKVGKAKVIAQKVSSCAFANVNEDGNLDKVIYTTVEEVNTIEKTQIYGVDYSGADKELYDANGKTVALVDKIQDTLFYTSDANTSCTFTRDVADISEGEIFDNGQRIFVYNKSIKNINLISKGDADEGYVYVGTESSSIMYCKLNNPFGAKTLVASADSAELLFVEDDRVYFSNDTTIGRISVKPLAGSDAIEAETLVTMSDVKSGEYGFDGQYVYFFAGLEDVEVEGEAETDENYYMYRVAKGGGDYQLIGKTVNERQPKVEA